MTEPASPPPAAAAAAFMARRFRGYLPVVIDIESGGFHAATDALLEIAPRHQSGEEAATSQSE